MAVPPQRVEIAIPNLQVYPYAFLMFAVVGFVFLWRRGRDSQLARWIGIWLVATSSLAVIFTVDYFLLSVSMWIIKQAYSTDGATVVWAYRMLFEVLVWLMPALAIAAVYGVLQGIVWGLVCALPAPVQPGGSRLYRWRCWRNLGLCGLTNAIVVLLPPLAHGSATTYMGIYLGHGHLISSLFGVALGWWMRRKTRAHSEVPNLGPWPAAAFVAVNFALALLFYAYNLPPGGLTNAAIGGSIASTSAFVAIALYLMIKRDFLHVRSIRSLVTLFLIVALPILFRLIENRIHPFLGRTPFFSQHGSELVVVLVAIWIFPKIHHYLEHFVRYFADRKLHEIEQTVDKALDAVIEAPNSEEKQKHIANLFTRLQVNEYAFYYYRGDGKFTCDAAGRNRPESASLELSTELRKFLGRHHAFLDLERSPFEWMSFFHMFDLKNLQRKTGCRYLLPVSVGDKLVALLFLPAGDSPAESDDPSLTASFKNLGVGVISRTGS